MQVLFYGSQPTGITGPQLFRLEFNNICRLLHNVGYRSQKMMLPTIEKRNKVPICPE
jgi:hypothetical protein